MNLIPKSVHRVESQVLNIITVLGDELYVSSSRHVYFVVVLAYLCVNTRTTIIVFKTLTQFRE